MNKKQTTTETSAPPEKTGGKPVTPSIPQKILVETVTKQKETGGPKGLEPTRYGDWEQKGRCTDF